MNAAPRPAGAIDIERPNPARVHDALQNGLPATPIAAGKRLPAERWPFAHGVEAVDVAVARLGLTPADAALHRLGRPDTRWIPSGAQVLAGVVAVALHNQVLSLPFAARRAGRALHIGVMGWPTRGRLPSAAFYNPTVFIPSALVGKDNPGRRLPLARRRSMTCRGWMRWADVRGR